jgi:hypothetical protein
MRPDPNDDGDRHRAADDVFEQTLEARDRLLLPPESYLHLPWAAVDALVGGIAPGDVWFVAGFSGNGKTTWLMNCVNELLEQGRTVYYLGLETRPSVLRTHLVCLRLGIYPGDVLSGKAKGYPDWPTVRPTLIEALEVQRRMGERDRFITSGVRHVDAAALRAASQDAALDKADVVVIDHVDHLRHGDGRNQHEESVRVVNLLLELAQDKHLRLLVATQCNNEAARGDRLGQYAPPQVHHVYMGSSKRMVATGMLGLYRPLEPNVDKATLADVRAGRREPTDVLAPNTMGVVVMKHRYYGGREGSRTTLRLEHGRLFDTPDRDRHTTTYGYQP